MKNYNIRVLSENMDSVLLNLWKLSNIEIRNVFRKTGLIQIKTTTLDNITYISDVLTIEKDTKFYINRIAIL
jgi:hypothetical protein